VGDLKQESRNQVRRLMNIFISCVCVCVCLLVRVYLYTPRCRFYAAVALTDREMFLYSVQRVSTMTCYKAVQRELQRECMSLCVPFFDSEIFTRRPRKSKSRSPINVFQCPTSRRIPRLMNDRDRDACDLIRHFPPPRPREKKGKREKREQSRENER